LAGNENQDIDRLVARGTVLLLGITVSLALAAVGAALSAAFMVFLSKAAQDTRQESHVRGHGRTDTPPAPVTPASRWPYRLGES